MKRILLSAVMALIAAVLPAQHQIAKAQTMNGYQLTSLWKEYTAASKADLPKKEAAALEKIKAEALAKHLPVDFYDAATLYVNVVQRRDWKQHDALRSTLAKEVEQFNEPIVTFLWMMEWDSASKSRLLDYVKAHPEGFQGNHPSLHKGIDGMLNGALQHFVQTDKEYVLWRLYSRNDDVYSLLKAELGGRYPADGILEYIKASDKYYSTREEECAVMQELMDRYQGTALGLFPESALLSLRFDALDSRKAPAGDYEALYKDCRAFEKRRAAFKGEEAVLAKACERVEGLVERLTQTDLSLDANQQEICLVFQNLPGAEVKLRQEKKVLQTWKVKNTARSFYLRDTVKLAMPVLPDGSYTVEAIQGDDLATDEFEQYTLSIATRTDSRGRCVYVTDYETGVPLRSFTLRLYKNGRELASSTMAQDGFTPIPQAFLRHMDKSDATFRVVAESGTRKTRRLALQSSFRPSNRHYEYTRCNIYKDRGAYNPGDTVKFKVIVYKGDPEYSLEVERDKKVEVRLHDSEDNVLETLTLTTNAWGSVSGSFVLPTGLRNGRFELEVVGIGADWFRVDEFVLPSFDLSWDRLDDVYFVGSQVPVSGKLISYSGHKLSGARIHIQVKHYGSTILQEDIPVADDNTFRFAFKAKDTGYYSIEAAVTDATGETLEFTQGYYIGDELQIEATVPDKADDNLLPSEEKDREWYWMRSTPRYTIETTLLKMKLQARDEGGNPVPLQVHYEVLDGAGLAIASGDTPSGELFSVQLPGAGLYRVKARVQALNAAGATVSKEQIFRIFCIPEGSRTLFKDVARVFLAGPLTVASGANISARMGTTEGDAWAVVTLYGKERQVLYHQMLHVSNDAVADISLPYLDAYPDAVRLQVFYFIHGDSVKFDRQYRREKDKYTLPLQFTRFVDKAFPGVEYSFAVKTAADAEALAAVWDKSMDAIATNDWPLVNTRDVNVENVYVSSVCGHVGTGSNDDVVAYGYGGMRTKGLGRARNSAVMMDVEMAAAPAPMEEMDMEEAVPFQLAESKPQFGVLDDVQVREEFSSALTFQPHLYPAADGTVNFSFRTSDKLSTFYVRVYAHDAFMHNAICEGEMVVSLPVKVSLLEPRYLYAGDSWQAAVTLSSMADEPVSGTIALKVGDTEQQLPVTVGPGETLVRSFTVAAPETAGELTVTAGFKAADFSDAVRVKIPVSPAAQVLTEAHSAVLRDGMDREALLRELRARFVNVPGGKASLKEITILDMVREAIPAHVEPSGADVLSLSEAWYIRLMAARLNGAESDAEEEAPAVADKKADAPLGASSSDKISDAELLEKVMACRNADGGFGWFEGMNSSPVITAVMLERFAKLRDRGFEVPDVVSAVTFLDKVQFGDVPPVWCGGLSDDQYVYVRSMYSEVPFHASPNTQGGKKRLAEFKKSVKANLTPSKADGRGLKGQILAKARRLLTLRNLNGREGGIALAKAWGITLGTSAKLSASIKADVASLLEYAVEHRDGGWYYPNAVMPWRGLLESEAYAHALLCDLMKAEASGRADGNAPSVADKKADAPSGASPSAAEVADGVRLWLMLQKETQKWDAEPAFIDAITAILDGSEAVLNTRVLALSATFEAPFKDIKASGNGFTIGRSFFRDGVEIKPGDPVKVGDKIQIRYSIWNAENRSFVKVTAGREASLSPVQQLSGHVGYGFIRPLRSGFVWGFHPQGYRNVKAACTEYYFDSYPEEKSELSEEFFVVRSGAFVAPVVTIESLYASHYRANAAYHGILTSTAD